ncbi:unnamed protein product [Auanema sp. JU1783]|nr:unnamed protein product [Auanema sp. JU1783]
MYLIACIAIALCVWFVFRRFLLENFYISHKGKYVFITGCDSGFGRLLALKLTEIGVNTFAGCFTQEGCDSLEKEGLNQGGANLVTLRLDITSEKSVEDARKFVEEYLEKKDAYLHAIVNNAGIFTIYGPDDWCSTDEYVNSLNVNTLGAIRVCHAFVPMLKKSKGRVVTMGSTAGRLHGLYVGPYVTAKFAVEAYMDCLRLELRPFGVSVHMLEPGCFKTNLLNEQAQNTRVDKTWSRLSEEVKEEYGLEFLRNFKTAWQLGVNLVANPNLMWVVSCYEHALFAMYPRLRYAPGWDAIFCFIPLSVFPTQIQDWVLSLMYSVQPGPPLIPKSLEKEKLKKSRFSSIAFYLFQLAVVAAGLVVFFSRIGLFVGDSNRVVLKQTNNTV